MNIEDALEVVSNVIECDIEVAEDDDNMIYAEDLKIALFKIRNFICDHLNNGASK